MAAKNSSQFNKLSDNVGKQVHVEFVNYGSRYLKSGMLKDVDPFRSISIDQAIVIPYNTIQFIGHEQAIISVLDDDGSLIYHNQHISPDYRMQSSEMLGWTRYFSGFENDFPGEKTLDDYASHIFDSMKMKELKARFMVEGGKVARKDARLYWNEVCGMMSTYSRWSIESALEVMEGLADGYHPDLDRISRKYGLSGMQYVGMEHLVHRCAMRPHPVIEHAFSNDVLPKRPKRNIF